jgi:micrococcal nuclease
VKPRPETLPITLLLNLIVVSALLFLLVEGATAQKQLSVSEVSKHIGETATVCGYVVSTKYASSEDGQPTFLNFGKPYPNQLFTVVIWGVDRDKFARPEVAYKGKRICVTGLITLPKKRSKTKAVPEIIADNPKAIKPEPKLEKSDDDLEPRKKGNVENAVPPGAREPKYTPPKGPGIRVEGQIPVPSTKMCLGLSERAEIECLCPRPLTYTLQSLPPPSDNNYATELTIKAVREPIYRLRVFSRTQISYATLTETWPHDKQAASFLERMEYDLYSIVMHSSAPQKRYKAIFHTAEGLRIKCINQEN